MLYVIINTGQSIRGTKFSPTRCSKIGENFLQVKISGYMVRNYTTHPDSPEASESLSDIVL